MMMMIPHVHGGKDITIHGRPRIAQIGWYCTGPPNSVLSSSHRVSFSLKTTHYCYSFTRIRMVLSFIPATKPLALTSVFCSFDVVADCSDGPVLPKPYDRQSQNSGWQISPSTSPLASVVNCTANCHSIIISLFDHKWSIQRKCRLDTRCHQVIMMIRPSQNHHHHQ